MWHPAGPFGTGPLNVNTRPEPPRPPRSVDNWWGIGIEVTAHALAVGKRMLHGNIMSNRNSSHVAEFHAQQWRFGPGLGGSYGAVAILGFNIASSNDLNAALADPGVDFELAAGVNSKMFLGAFQILRPLAEAAGAGGILKGGLRGLAGYERVGERIDHALDIKDAGKFSKPALVVMPVGAGLQAAIYYGVAADVLYLNWTADSR